MYTLWFEYDVPSQAQMLKTWSPASGTILEGDGNFRR
jgi:hypothetical protein